MPTKPAGCFLQLAGGAILLMSLAFLLDGGWSTVKGVVLAAVGLGIMFLGGLPAVQKK